MRRHSWKDTGVRADHVELPVRDGATIEKCVHCGGERVADRDFTTSYLYRNTLGRTAQTPLDRWLGSGARRAGAGSRVPPCAERQ